MLDLLELIHLHPPFETLLLKLPWCDAVRLSLTCKAFHATQSLISAAFRRDVKQCLLNKQTAHIASVLGVQLRSRPRNVGRAGGYSSLLLCRLCEKTYSDRNVHHSSAVSSRWGSASFRKQIRDLILDLIGSGVPACWCIGTGKYSGSSILHVAAREDDQDLMRAIINGGLWGPLTRSLDPSRLSALSRACLSSPRQGLLFLESFNWPKIPNESCTPLFAALRMRLLVSREEDHRHLTALIALLAQRQPWSLSRNCRSGALFAAPLHVASTAEDAEELCKAGADPNATTIGGYRVVSRIAAANVRWLPAGDRPLHWHLYRPDVVLVLLAANANPSLVGSRGQTPLELASADQGCPPETAQMLLEARHARSRF